METLLIVFAVLLVAIGLIFLVGHALGDPRTGRAFDETPADVAVLDTSDVSDGTPLDLDIPRRMTPEEQAQASKDFERLRVRIEAGRRA